MNNIGHRIQQLVDEFSEGNVSKFAILAETSEANIRNYIAGTQPKFKTLETIASKIEISCEWLLLGKGEMKRSFDIAAEPMPVYKPASKTCVFCDEKDKQIELLRQTVADKVKIIQLLEMQLSKM